MRVASAATYRSGLPSPLASTKLATNRRRSCLFPTVGPRFNSSNPPLLPFDEERARLSSAAPSADEEVVEPYRVDICAAIGGPCLR